MLHAPSRIPTESLFHQAAVKFQESRLMRCVWVTAVDPVGAVAPGFAEQVNQFPCGDAITFLRADVVTACESRVLSLLLRNQEIGKERLQHMLIGADGMRIADDDRLTFLYGPYTVRDNTVFGEISAADDIAGAGGGDGRKIGETPFIAGCRQLRTGLGIAVGVKAVENIVFAKLSSAFVIPVNLVRRDNDGRLHGGCLPDRLQDIDRAHEVGVVGLSRV